MATGRIGVTPTLRTRWSKAPAGGTTSLSGLDDNSVSLVYDVGYEAVYRNGVLLSRTNDYTATTGNSITLIDATIAGDIIEVFANQLLPLTNAIGNGQYTAKGALLSATAASTPAVLTVGSNDQVLTADSSTSTGLKWAAPAGGANWTLLNAGGTALTGAQTITVSGISNKSQVMFFIAGGSSANGSSLFSFRINSDSGSNYNQFGANLSWQNTYSSGNYTAISNTSQSDYYLHYGAGNAAGVFSGYVFLTGCNSSGVKSIIAGTGATQTGNETSYTGGYWNNSASVTSISLLSSSGNFDAGTIYVYTSA